MADSALYWEKLMYITDWGEFEVPEDVPIRALRKDGWFDRRRKVTKPLQQYFSDMTDRLRDEKPILTWEQWHGS